MTNKRKIYLNEYNIPTGDSIYLPYSSGLLQAYAKQSSYISQNYEFIKIFFQRDTVDNIVAQYEDPDVVGFSVSMWNYELSCAVAKELRYKFPHCLIVFGGPHVTNDIDFCMKHPYLDHVIYREGEKVFTHLLWSRCGYGFDKDSHNWRTIHDPSPPKDLDVFPSPYVAGIFDNIIADHPELEFKAIIETNRNCPFNCAFCYWGSNEISNKIRYHGLDYLKEEFEWIAKNKIQYVFCADANFGMYKRDTDIAQTCADIKNQYGYPEKFRVCYGKNATKNIFNAATILSRSNLAKTVTLSVQSFNQDTLDSINRKNIKVDNFKKLQQQYNAVGIPTYTEIILGLPSETKQSFLDGLESAIRLTKDNQIFIYHCQVLPNTKLSDLNYQKQYDIQTIKIPLAEVHVTARQDDFVQEYDEIIVKTSTMTTQEWVECTVISWWVQMFQSLKLGNQIMDWIVNTYGVKYLDLYKWMAESYDLDNIVDFNDIALDIVEGHPRCQMDSRFGNIFYEIEEITYLKIVSKQELFFDTLYAVLASFLNSKDLDIEPYILSTVFKEQMDSLPSPDDFDDLQDFATQVILYGRKNNKITPVDVLS